MPLIGLLLLAVAYAMLWPGLTEPMLTLAGTVEKAKLVDIGREILAESANTSGLVRGLADRFLNGLDVTGTVSAFDKSNSILGTAGELWRGGNALVAVLIVSFSVIVPAIKALITLATFSPLPETVKRPLVRVAAAAGKWSMADVFVIAIFIAFLAGAGMSETRGLVEFTARLESGFWWFLGYCLVSILASQLMFAGASATSPVQKRRATAPARSPAAKRAPRKKTAARSGR